MSNAVEATQTLEQLSQKHEKELVIEFGRDRVLQYVGVYLVAFLAVVAKISELAASNLSCHPAGNSSVKGDFISYATVFCWESTTVVNRNRSDAGGNTSGCTSEGGTQYEENLLRDPSFFKIFVQSLPYAMILEALLFSLPSLWWHNRVGAKLMGHIKFMKLLLNDIYEAVKPIEKGFYRKGSSYDSDSYYLDGGRGYDPNYKKPMHLRCVECPPGCLRRRNDRRRRGETSGSLMEMSQEIGNNENREGREQTEEEEEQMSEEQDQGSEENTQGGLFERIIYGGMRDRHFFSMLCFENFSSLEHHPYILSVYKLSKVRKVSPDKAFTGSKTQGILRLMCNKNNFGRRYLVKTYLLKHLLGAVVAVFVLIATGLVLNKIGMEGWYAESFRCDIIYHLEVCMICTIRRKVDMIVYLLVNLFINVLYLILSVRQLVYVRLSSNRSISHYFEEISDCGSAALNRAGIKSN